MSFIHKVSVKCSRCAWYATYRTRDIHDAWTQAKADGWGEYIKGNDGSGMHLCPRCCRVWVSYRHYAPLPFPVNIDKV